MARLARYEPSLDVYDRATRSDVTDPVIKETIDKFHREHNHPSPNKKDVIKRRHPDNPAQFQSAIRIYRYEPWVQLFSEFQQEDPNTVLKIADPNHPDDCPMLFRTCAPWELCFGKDSSCLCTGCENTNTVFRGKKKAKRQLEII